MRHFSITAFVLVVAVLSADRSAVVAQVTPPIGQGSRVRITAPSLGLNEAVGTVQEATDDAFVIQLEFPRTMGPVARSEITAMDVSLGQQRKVIKSLGVGALVGAVGGVFIGLASGDDDPQQWFAFTAEEKAFIAGGVLGLAGGVVGLIVGLAQRHEVWSPVLPGNVDLTVLPLVRESGAGLHVGLAFQFQ